MLGKTTPRHPAKYSEPLLDVFKYWLYGCERVLDPFAGTGRLADVIPGAIVSELEFEWIQNRERGVVADATALPFADGSFDAVCTSPTYGNRMADAFIDGKPGKYQRNTYTHAIGRKLSPNNSGAMQWGDAYRDLHKKAWAEAFRVLRPGGRLIINISDHIRQYKRIRVSLWHLLAAECVGFEWVDVKKVRTRRFTQGANPHRVEFETVYLFEKERYAE